MYFPYLRGKQYELIALRKISDTISNGLVKPIIEPVRSNLSPLQTTLRQLNDQDIEPIIIINPIVGDLSNQSPEQSLNLLDNIKSDDEYRCVPCVIISPDTSASGNELVRLLRERNQEYALYVNGLSLDEVQDNITNSSFNIFPTKSYADNSQLPQNSILISDPFPRESRNADYSINETVFSNAHLPSQYQHNQIGFSDFLTVGERWSESGGPAYVIAIHLTYINNKQSNVMYVKHCLSDTNSKSPANPAAKFFDALNILINFVNANQTTIDSTVGLQSLQSLHEREHYPGLGEIKKLSIMHHIETLSNFLSLELR